MRHYFCDSNAKLTISITSGASLQERLCYYDIKLWQLQQLPKTYGYKSRFTSIVELMLSSDSSLNLLRQLKNLSNSTFLCWKTKNPTFYCPMRGKHQFSRINLLTENHFTGVFYWLNVFHSGFSYWGELYTADLKITVS